MEENDITPELLREYAKGTCSEAERIQVEKWLELENPEEPIPAFSEDINKAALASRLWEAVAPVPRRSKNRQVWIWPAAAILLIVPFLSLFLQQSVEDTGRINLQTLEVGPGQKLTAKLPDGSQVQLNSESRIWYSISDKQRIVVLEGEALFDVAPDSLHPFYVKTAYGKVRVLGTSFAVRSYPHHSHTRVDVRSGKVACSPKNKTAAQVLTKGESISFDKINAREKTRIATTQIAPWSSNILVFDQESLPEVCRKIERWFGVAIHIESSKDRQQANFRSRFDNPSLKQVIESLCYSLQLRYRIEEQNIYIFP
ncbi:FecR family protein [Sphingobacterium corticibacterium]|uniref:FecR family protein n=1 Tax=Sphingobacterium corticibacterium TaxID=2484746 RepID=A0A4Q6XPB0_9SPHI|nr:FecR family protein [Sphingobacterium corticibacterium]RZF61515.1 FecR family protein [Sphingobacterium corticibacterium]